MAHELGESESNEGDRELTLRDPVQGRDERAQLPCLHVLQLVDEQGEYGSAGARGFSRDLKQGREVRVQVSAVRNALFGIQIVRYNNCYHSRTRNSNLSPSRERCRQTCAIPPRSNRQHGNLQLGPICVGYSTWKPSFSELSTVTANNDATTDRPAGGVSGFWRGCGRILGSRR